MRSRTGSVSGHDRSHQRLGSDDVARTERAISAVTFESVLLRKCVARMRAFIVPKMLDCLATLAHGAVGFHQGGAAQIRADADAAIVESAALALPCTAIKAHNLDRLWSSRAVAACRSPRS